MVNQPGFEPKYLPVFVHGEEPIICEETIETLAFILSGIDPAERHAQTNSRCSFREFVADLSVKRISTSSVMRQDYEYVLSPHFDFNQVDFEDIWLDAKQVPSGQEGTEFLKLFKRIRGLKVNEDFDDLSSRNQGLKEQVRKCSHRLLHRIHRTAIRQIAESLETPRKPPSRPWSTWLLGRIGLSKSHPVLTLNIDEDIRKCVVRYAEDVIKIGCLLRSRVRRG
jgi:hypothetical protein